MTLRNDENTNGDNIQEVMAEVKETAEEESIPGPINFDENVEENEGENEIGISKLIPSARGMFRMENSNW